MRPIRGRSMRRPTRGRNRDMDENTPRRTRAGMGGRNPIMPNRENVRPRPTPMPMPTRAGMKKGGKVKKHRGDGCCMKGKTKGRMV